MSYNEFEKHLFSATHSEHCGYLHSRELLKELPREGAIYPYENAGGIKIGNHAILFKMESHNHPCAVEPFNGAATGIGGIVRDVLAMNARPIALCNSLKFGDDKRIINGVVDGISTYGNSIGVPTVSTEVLYDKCFTENPLVNVTAIGIAKTDDILTSSTAYAGLKLMLVGSHTMRDGMGGAAFASKELEGGEDKLSIQIANPFMKKKLIEGCLEIFARDLVVSCQDCGAAGILSSTSEVAYKSNCGVEIDLSKIHIGDSAIKDFEIMLSETQERMLFVVKEENIPAISEILHHYEIPYSLIGDVIEDKRYIVKGFADISTDILINAPKVPIDFSEGSNPIIRPLRDMNSAAIYEQYDHTVGARTQLQPADCPNFNSLWIYEENCSLGIYTFSAYGNTYDAIINTALKMETEGFEPRGITNCLNFANPEIAPTMYEFRKTIREISKACNEIGIPVCSGNVSFYNKTPNVATFTMLGVAHKSSF